MSTAFDNSWSALTSPGQGKHYFNIDYPRFSLDQTYHQNTALWLAELSRLIYRNLEQTFLGRAEILRKVSLREVGCFNQPPAYAVVLENQQEGTPHFFVLVFRGTYMPQDWLTNLNTFLTSWPEGGRVHRGFKNALERVWDNIEECLSTLQGPVFYTGHSLGAALATLVAARHPPHALYTFGTPRVGDQEFSKLFEKIKAYRVVNHRDIVSIIPPTILGFCHVGEPHYITHNGHIAVALSEHEIEMDRKKIDPNLRNCVYHRRWFDPPSCLFNHAPVNYVAHLERLL